MYEKNNFLHATFSIIARIILISEATQLEFN